MKIPLKLVDGRIVVNAIILSENYHFGASPILFVIDTGSDATFISEQDALRLQISTENLRSMETFQMAGAKYDLVLGKGISLYFKTDENKSSHIDFSNVPIARSTIRKKTEDSGFPSILGTDFLLKNNFSLYFSPNKKIIFLEKDEK